MASSTLSPAEVAQLGEELQLMLRAGVPIDIGLKGLVGTTTGRLSDVAGRLSKRLESGQSLAAAMEEESSLPANLKSILIAGSRVGRSEEALQDLVDMSFALSSIQAAFYRGLIYPFVLLIGTAALCLLCLTVLLPRVIDTYELLRVPLPFFLAIWLPIAASEIGLVILGIAAIAILIAARWFGIGARLSHWLGWKRVEADLAAAQTAQLLSLLTKYDVPLPEALEIAAAQPRMPKWSESLKQIQAAIHKGETLNQASLERRGLPSFLAWLIESGVREGTLPATLSDAANFYRTRGLRRAGFLQKAIPRILILVVGGGVTLIYGIAVFGTLSHLWIGVGETRL